MNNIPKEISDFHELTRKKPYEFSKKIHKAVLFVEKLLDRKDIEYKKNDPEAFEEFCLTLKHQKGIWAGKPFILSIEQKWIVYCILGIKTYDKIWKKWIRYFRECFIAVSRKWGKSLFGSALAIWFCAFDREAGAEVLTFATNKDQARKVYDPISQLIKNNPILKPNFKQQTFDGIPRMIVKGTNNYISYGSGSVKGKVGSNPHLAIFDEIHEITRTELYDAMTSGQGARLQPMTLMISTAGIIRGSLYDAKLDVVDKMCRKNSFDDDVRLFFAIFEIDADDDPDDEKCWIKANPGIRENRPTMAFLRKEHKSAQLDITKRPTFLAMNLNRPTNNAMTYIELDELKNARINILTDMIYNSYAFGGSDLSDTTDLTCNTALIPINNECSKFIFIQRYYVAKKFIDKNSERDKVIYRNFTNTNSKEPICSRLLEIVECDFIDKETVAKWFAELEQDYKVTFLKIGYDRWKKTEYLKYLTQYFDVENVTKDENGVDIRDTGVITDVAQGVITTSDPIKTIKKNFTLGNLKYDITNALFEFCINNAKVTSDSNMNLKVDKSKSTGRIDGFDSLIDAWVAMERGKDIYLSINKNNNKYQSN